MRIVMITPDCYMIDRRILLEAKTLVNVGHKVTLLAGFECEEESSYEKDGIVIHRYRFDWRDDRFTNLPALLPDRLGRCKSFLERAYRKAVTSLYDLNSFEHFMYERITRFEADVYHVHDFPCLRTGVYAARERKVPLVYDAHELYYSHVNLPEKVQKRYFMEEKKYIGQADVAITVNQFIAELMGRQYGIRTPEVIMNCAEAPCGLREDGVGLKLREKAGIPAGWRIVLYQGWLSRERNLDTLIRGVRYFPDNCCLAVIGYGDHEKDLRRIAEEEKSEGKVFFLGPVPSEEMLYYTAEADVGVIPYLPVDQNHYYCSPNKFFEYVLAGIPVVANDLPFFRMMQERYGVAHTADMTSPRAIGEAVRELLSDSAALGRLRRNCLEAGRELNWENEGKKLLNIYDSIGRAKGHRGRASEKNERQRL